MADVDKNKLMSVSLDKKEIIKEHIIQLLMISGWPTKNILESTYEWMHQHFR